jgi:arylsulfatase A-like enzyme
MRAIQIMFDSLNRRMLQPYGATEVSTPNFLRLAERAVLFDRAYVGSMPCMPARRELHTGRYNFLHRSWGPLEPFDDSTPEILKRQGISTHLFSDHYHYWEEGGANYHTKYSTWECIRGQEGDPWKADLTRAPDRHSESLNNRVHHGPHLQQDWINRHYMRRERDFPQARTFQGGIEFLERHHRHDGWFLHIETFDPHEPYFAPRRFLALYRKYLKGPHFDWPPYRRVEESEEAVRHCWARCAALHTMCDDYLGRILDLMDRYDLWKDTLLIVNTDHGFLLGEHGWWAKCVQPFYNEIAHIPLFLWDPRSRVRGERRRSLVQTIDLPATLLEFFGLPLPPDMQGRPLRETVERDAPIREAALFGLFGAQVNVTDGRYVYMRAPVRPDNTPLYEYTLMPAHMRQAFGVDELQSVTLADPFPFTKGCRTLKIPAKKASRPHGFSHWLFDLDTDPRQKQPILSPEIESRMIEQMIRLMKANHVPPEQFERLGLGTHTL